MDWAHAHPCAAGEAPAGWGAADLHGEGLVPLAGDGAPLVAEFAPATSGAHVGLTTDAALDLLGDALELCHRLPRLWQLVRGAHQASDRLAGADRLPAWRARQAAQATRSLTPDVVDEVDRWLSQTALINANKVTSVEIAKTVAACRAHVDPEHAEAKAKADVDHRHVTLTARHRSPADVGGPLSGGVTEVTMLLDTPDAVMFDNTVP